MFSAIFLILAQSSHRLQNGHFCSAAFHLEIENMSSAATARVDPPKTRKGKRHLEERAPKVVENTKRVMLIKGGQTSEVVSQALKDIYVLKKPCAVMFKRRNTARPFEESSSLEFFSDRNDASLFAFGSHSKKRPHNLVLGRMFDYRVLDMFELGIQKFLPMSYFKSAKSMVGSKPCVVFNGPLFDTDSIYERLKNLLLDFFRGPVADRVCLEGLDHVFSVTASDEGRLLVRHYRILLRKSGVKTPRIELEEIGPSFDLVLRRHQMAPSHLYKEACKVPRTVKPKAVKNISYDAFGTKMGRVHMQRQDFLKLQTRKRRALKQPSSSKAKRSKAANQ